MRVNKRGGMVCDREGEKCLGCVLVKYTILYENVKPPLKSLF